VVVSSKFVQWNPRYSTVKHTGCEEFFYRKCIIGVIGGSGPNSVLKEAYLRLPNPWRDLYRTKTAVLLLICSTYLKVFHYNAFLCQHPISLCNTAMALYWCLTRLKVR